MKSELRRVTLRIPVDVIALEWPDGWARDHIRQKYAPHVIWDGYSLFGPECRIGKARSRCQRKLLRKAGR